MSNFPEDVGEDVGEDAEGLGAVMDRRDNHHQLFVNTIHGQLYLMTVCWKYGNLHKKFPVEFNHH